MLYPHLKLCLFLSIAGDKASIFRFSECVCVCDILGFVLMFLFYSECMGFFVVFIVCLSEQIYSIWFCSFTSGFIKT